MARLFIDGFEHGSAGLWDDGSDGLVDSSSKITGTYCFSNNSLYKAGGQLFQASKLTIRKLSDGTGHDKMV